MAELVENPTADTYISEQNQSTNYNSQAVLLIGANAVGRTVYDYASLLQFAYDDIGSPTFDSVDFDYWVEVAAASGANTVKAVRMLTTWTSAEATWDYASSKSFWAGGDFSSSDWSATNEITFNLHTTTGAKTTDITALGQDLYDNSDTMGIVNNNSSSYSNQLESIDDITVDGAPTLTFTYPQHKKKSVVISSLAPLAGALGGAMMGVMREMYKGPVGEPIQPRYLVNAPMPWRHLPVCRDFSHYRRVLRAIREGAPRRQWQALAGV